MTAGRYGDIMRVTDCTIEYGGDLTDGPFEPVKRGAMVMNGKPPTGKVSLYFYDDEAKRFRPLDALVNVSVESTPKGYRLAGNSLRAEQAFKPGNAFVEVIITVNPGCKECG